jgi:hypothetical protein
VRVNGIDMGVIEFAGVDIEALGKADEEVAAEYDKLRAARDAHVNSVIAQLESNHKDPKTRRDLMKGLRGFVLKESQ